MQRCPHCQQALEDGQLPICWHCGREIHGEPALPTPQLQAGATVQQPQFDSPALFDFDHLVEQLGLEPADDTEAGIAPPMAAAAEPSATPMFAEHAAAPPPPVRAAAARPWTARLPDWKRHRIPILGLGGLGAVVLVLSVMGRPQPTPVDVASPPASVTPSAPAQVPTSKPAPVPEPKPVSTPTQAPTSTPPASIVIDEAPGWVIPRRIGFASDGSRTMTMELPALRDLQVSREHIRPVLAVRCLSRRTEVFVALGTSAAIEAGDTNHVTVQLDDQPPASQQWLRTDSYRELFSQDGLALARQFIGASLLRFTFTPFHSRPVVAEFNVRGFDQHVSTLARTCGWPAQPGIAKR